MIPGVVSIIRFALLLIIGVVFGCGSGGDSTSSATAKCSDGSLSYSQNCSGTCSSHGGVSVWYVSGCGSKKIVPNAVVTPVIFYNNYINGLWSGTFSWHKNGEITRGTIFINILNGKITRGELYIGSNGEKYDISGGIDTENGITIQVANTDNTLLSGDIEIDSNHNIVANINAIKPSKVNLADGIIQLDLAKQ